MPGPNQNGGVTDPEAVARAIAGGNAILPAQVSGGINASGSTFFRGDGNWAVPPYGPGCVNVYAVGDSLTANQLPIGWKHTLEGTTGANIGFMMSYRRGQQGYPAAGGVGTMRFYINTGGTPYLTWSAPTDAEGLPTYIRGDGVFVIPSRSANLGMEVAIQRSLADGTSNMPTANKSDTTTMTASSWFSTAGNVGPTVWANALMGHPLRFNSFYSGSGMATPFAVAAVNQAIAAMGLTPGVIRLAIGSVDMASDVTVAQAIANFDIMIAAVMASPHYLMLVNVIPRSDSGWQATLPSGLTWAQKVLKVKQLNAYFSSVAATNSRIVVIDAFSQLVDFTSTTDNPNSGMLTTDDVHYASGGAYRAGVPEASALSTFVPPVKIYTTSFADIYDATFNKTGNLINTAGAGLFAGTGGSAGTGVVGGSVIAAGWRLTRTTGADMTATASKVSATFGDFINPDAMKVVFDNVAGAVSNEFTLDRTTGLFPSFGTNYNVGDALQSWMILNVDTNIGLEGVELLMTPNGTSGNFACVDGFFFTVLASPIPNSLTKTLTLVTPDDSPSSLGWVIPTGRGVTSVALTWKIRIAAGGSCNITFGACKGRKIVNGR